MEFRKQKAIFQQIAEGLCERIVRGEWGEDERIDSVRDVAATLGVTPNTVMRSFEWLSQKGIIYSQRGTGYYVSADARKRIIDMQRADFIENDIPQFVAKMHMLGLTLSDVQKYL